MLEGRGAALVALPADPAVPATANGSGTKAGLDPTDAIDRPSPPSAGIFEPPDSFVLAAIGAHKLVVCICAVSLALIGVGYGLTRPTTYTASATLQVGQVNPNSPGFYGYVQSATSLATAFSRSIEAEPVLATIQRKLKLAPAAALPRLSAEPLPLSPAFRIVATGPTEAGAIALTNTAARAVIAYESQSNSANPEARSLLHNYRGAALALGAAEARLTYLGKHHALVDQLPGAEASRSAAQVKLKAISDAYVSAVSSQAPRSGLVSLVAGASTAASNRKSKVELLGFVGLLAGIITGCAAAVLLERRRRGPRHGTQAEDRDQSPQPL
jgi:uncharacterized protein involved in exopolysaccharide biosynthesis